ncbi:MAG: tRNA (adenosine(37)-N6)-threonylcarbamoyltransferase complex ATPase subunit type 1 TsaE [Candidatus Omnitrophica bacterium]|nr:tRNA (adenosine(37)-N6)-threonylcarbamoyltransferase complex ATPase subunit type 1 TsaE [Candidatus Omnitrophota bacterium]
MIKKYSLSAIETIALGENFSKNLKPGDVVIFEGVLGGGKTTFIKGILEGLKIRCKVLSPSFTLVRNYTNNKLHVYHIDLYRLNDEEIFDFGIEDFLYGKNSITLIEWGEKIEHCLSRYLKVVFSILGEEKRQIEFSSKGYRENKFLLG